MGRAWGKFRGWPTWAHWTIGVLVALVAVGAASGGGDRKKAIVTAASGTSTSTTEVATNVAPTTTSTVAFPAARTKSALCRFNGALPDAACTPGALNPDVTQATIATTICTANWTTTVRPATTVTDRLKTEVGAAYGIADPLSQFQGDHLIPLELGGAPSDIANFWDEPNALTLADGTAVGSESKDALESALNKKVCSGQMALIDAQRQIAGDWYASWNALGRPGGSATLSTTSTTSGAGSTTTNVRVASTTVAPSPTASAGTQTSPSATTSSQASAPTCTASVSNPSPTINSMIDVLVSSSLANATVSATAHYKTTDTTNVGGTDGAGKATVPFRISHATSGYTVGVDVSVGAAHCRTSFTPQ